jgi:ABC-type nitrate/sulfonate/bicarbonate transport system substrate-binding protein
MEPPMMDRRRFLTRALQGGAGAVALGVTGTGLLAACGSSTKTASSAPTTTAGTTAGTAAANTPMSLGSASLQLDWIEDIEFAGSYIAKSEGYYTKNGLDVTLLAGGPSTAVEPIVVSGKALVGLSGPDITSEAIANGAKLTIVGAQMQKAPQAIMSLAKSPIENPQGMIGKKIGVQAGNLISFKAFLSMNNIPQSKVDIVPVQFDPSPLAAGTVDGWYSFITNEPFLLAAKGVATHTWLMYDYGYRLYSGTYCVRTSSLTDATQRAQIKAIMTGEVLGWEKAFADPSLAASLTVNVYGKTNGLDIPTQTKELAAYQGIFETPTTAAHGLLWLDPTQVAQNVSTLALLGIKSSTSYFDNSILEEIYQGKSSLSL